MFGNLLSSFSFTSTKQQKLQLSEVETKYTTQQLVPNDKFFQPPFLKDLMDSIVNFDREEKIPVTQISSHARERIFNFSINGSSTETLFAYNPKRISPRGLTENFM